MSQPKPPIELDTCLAGSHKYLDISYKYNKNTEAFTYTVVVNGPDGAPLYNLQSSLVMDRTSIALLIADALAKDPHFGFGRDQLPYRWTGAYWSPVEKWMMSLDYSMHAIVRTSIGRDTSLTAEAYAAWRANSDYPTEGLDLTAFGTCPGIPLLDGIMNIELYAQLQKQSAASVDVEVEDVTSEMSGGEYKQHLQQILDDLESRPETPDPLAEPLPHNPKHMNLMCFPFEYREVFSCLLLATVSEYEPVEKSMLGLSLLGKFLSSSLTRSQIEVFQKWLGYHLVLHAIPNPEKMMYMYGSGANGKSQLLHLIRGLVGPHACAELRLSDLRVPSNIEGLQGKIAVLGAEANTKTELERLKSLISREPQHVNPKYRDPFTITPECLITQASNYPPSFDERSDAMERRIILLHLKNSFKDAGSKVEDIAAQILENDYATLFGFALEGASKILQDGRFTVPADIEEESKQSVKKGNPFELFAANLQWGGYEVSTMELHAVFSRWCVDEGGMPKAPGKQMLLDELTRLAAKAKKPLSQGRSKGYKPSGWHDKAGKKGFIVPQLIDTVSPEVIEGLRYNDRNGLVVGNELPKSKKRLWSTIDEPKAKAEQSTTEEAAEA